MSLSVTSRPQYMRSCLVNPHPNQDMITNGLPHPVRWGSGPGMRGKVILRPVGCGGKLEKVLDHGWRKNYWELELCWCWYSIKYHSQTYLGKWECIVTTTQTFFRYHYIALALIYIIIIILYMNDKNKKKTVCFLITKLSIAKAIIWSCQ